RWVAIACSSDRMFQRLATTMGRAELAGDPRYQTMRERDNHREELNAMVSEWVGALTADEVLARCEANETACGLLYDIADIFADPQYRERGNIKRLADERVGE